MSKNNIDSAAEDFLILAISQHLATLPLKDIEAASRVIDMLLLQEGQPDKLSAITIADIQHIETKKIISCNMLHLMMSLRYLFKQANAFIKQQTNTKPHLN